MTLRVVTLSLIVAIGVGSPAIASNSADEQQVKGRGARDRGSNSGSGGENRSAQGGGDNGGGNAGATRTANRRDEGEQRGATPTADRSAEPQRYAVPKDSDRDSYRDSSRIVVNRRPSNVNLSYGSSYRGPRYYTPVQYDRWARHYAHWSPIGYAPWSLIYGSIGFSNFGVAFGSPYYAYGGYGNYGFGYPYAYGPAPYSPWVASGTDIGGVRLKMRPRDAQVFVDGYYAGLVDDFDGSFQSLRLESGGHKIEIHMPGFQDLELDVLVQPGRTITVGEDLKPRP
jgi:hypothetical protein